MYVDKPMKDHNLMQAIARVNRVFGDKPGGLVVDYIGIATALKEAMLTYSQSGGTGDATNRQEKAVEVMLEKLEICRDVFHGFTYSGFFSGSPKVRLALLPAARGARLAQRRAIVAGAGAQARASATATMSSSRLSASSRARSPWQCRMTNARRSATRSRSSRR